MKPWITHEKATKLDLSNSMWTSSMKIAMVNQWKPNEHCIKMLWIVNFNLMEYAWITDESKVMI